MMANFYKGIIISFLFLNWEGKQQMWLTSMIKKISLCRINYFLMTVVLGKVYKIKYCKISSSRVPESPWSWEGILGYITYSNGRGCIRHFTYTIFFRTDSQRPESVPDESLPRCPGYWQAALCVVVRRLSDLPFCSQSPSLVHLPPLYTCIPSSPTDLGAAPRTCPALVSSTKAFSSNRTPPTPTSSGLA